MQIDLHPIHTKDQYIHVNKTGQSNIKYTGGDPCDARALFCATTGIRCEQIDGSLWVSAWRQGDDTREIIIANPIEK